jgi:hypothetical protein
MLTVGGSNGTVGLFKSLPQTVWPVLLKKAKALLLSALSVFTPGAKLRSPQNNK